MAWFKRKSKGIQTPTESKRDIPKGLWYKSPTGKVVDTEELQENFYVSPEDDYHVRIGSKEYFDILFDDKFKEYLNKYGYEYTPTDYAKIPSRYWELLLYRKESIKFIDIVPDLC